MQCEIQLSSRSAAALLAQIYGPVIGDFPRRDKGASALNCWVLESNPNPDPWYALMLNPRPVSPGERRVLALADAHIKEFIRLDRLGTMLGGEVTGRVIEQSLRSVANIGERCPAWPEWPNGWAVPLDPNPRATMTSDELLVFGSLMLSASELIGLEPLRDALVDLGEKVLSLSMDEGPLPRLVKQRQREEVTIDDRQAVAAIS